MSRRVPAPWTVEKIPGGFVVVDANGQQLAHVYADNRQIVKTLRMKPLLVVIVNAG